MSTFEFYFSIPTKTNFLPSASSFFWYSIDDSDAIDSLLNGVTQHELDHKRNNDSVLATSALPHTKKHQYLIDKVTNDFLSALANVPGDKWSPALVPVQYKSVNGKKKAPKILVSIGGKKTPAKVALANKALIDWMSTMRKKGGGKCIWYQPSTQNQRLRTLLGSCAKRFGWEVKIEDFCFENGLKGFLDALYAKRYKEFGKVRYRVDYFLFNIPEF